MTRRDAPTKAELNDLRILKLAEMYELAFEHFIHEMATSVIHDPRTRHHIAALIGFKASHHEQLVGEINRMNAALVPEDQAGVEHAALLDVIEVERAARAFYITYVDHVRDPKVVALFRRLARDEARHITIVQDALTASDARADAP